MLTSSPGESLSSLEAWLKSLFAKEALNFFIGLYLGTASVSPCWNTQGWEAITEDISAHIWDMQVLWATPETGRRWKMKGPLLSTSFQHPLKSAGIQSTSGCYWQPATCWQHPERKRSSVSPYLSVSLFVLTEGKVWGEAEAGSCVTPVEPA